MTTEQQDKAWACLPKEVRDAIKYRYSEVKGYFPERASELSCIYGLHNLTSDTEPEEMLTAERKYIQEMYSDGVGQHYLHALFGDKCLPDKEEQAKPKFKVGDKVRIILCTHPEYRNKVGIITSIDSCGNLYVKVEGLGTLFHADYALEPYTEEKKLDLNKLNEMLDEALEKETPESMNEWIDNQTKNDMEEKELNLCELLKGCEGEKFYSPVIGECVLKAVTDYIHVIVNDHPSYCFFLDGRREKSGAVIFYPSRALYEKYPLDAKKAWSEWAESRKPKRWRAEDGECYWWINPFDCQVFQGREENDKVDDRRYNAGLYFRTEEEAQQAAEGIREYLQKFHEKNSEK